MIKFIKGLFYLLCVLALLAALGKIFIFELVTIDSYSMIPNLVPGDLVLIYTKGEIDLGDIVVCKNPNEPENMVLGRVLGIPGSTISIKSNIVSIGSKEKHPESFDSLIYIDNTSGEMLEYLVDTAYEKAGGHRYQIAQMSRAGEKYFPKTEIGDGLFLLGDNRNRAIDSRIFGEVPIENCIGTAMFVLWPGEDAGDLRHKDRYFKCLF